MSAVWTKRESEDDEEIVTNHRSKPICSPLHPLKALHDYSTRLTPDKSSHSTPFWNMIKKVWTCTRSVQSVWWVNVPRYSASWNLACWLDNWLLKPCINVSMIYRSSSGQIKNNKLLWMLKVYKKPNFWMKIYWCKKKSLQCMCQGYGGLRGAEHMQQNTNSVCNLKIRAADWPVDLMICSVFLTACH